MEKDYDYALIIGSFMIAFLTSFLAIAYASFIIWHKRYNSKIWTYGAAFNMGMGIWTMHFIGMLALHLDIPIAFDIFETILSAAIAVIGSYLAFRILLKTKYHNSKQRKLLAAFILGTSVAGMHYMGMDAMQMFPPIQYNTLLVITSLVIAYSASYVGLEIFIRSAAREKHNVFILNNLMASVVIGIAIAAMHYTGMAAANFDLGSYCTVKQGIEVGPLAAYVVSIVTLILITSFMFIIYEQGQDTKRALLELEETNANLEYLVKKRTEGIQQALEDLKNTQNLLIENEKMASLGGLVAGVAHEINTPLGIGLTSGSLLKEKVMHLNDLFKTNKITQTALTDFLQQSQETCTILENNLYKAAALIASFKQLAVDQTSNQTFTFNVYDTIHSSLNSLNNILKKQKIQSILSCDEQLTTNNNAGSVSQVLTNLIMNASIHAFDDSTPNPTIEVKAIVLANNGLEIQFIDNGKGMDAKVIEKVFEPFFTTRRGHGGSGLGLYLVYNLVNRELKGTIKVQSELGKGTIFIIKIPSQLDLT